MDGPDPRPIAQPADGCRSVGGGGRHRRLPPHAARVAGAPYGVDAAFRLRGAGRLPRRGPRARAARRREGHSARRHRLDRRLPRHRRLRGERPSAWAERLGGHGAAALSGEGFLSVPARAAFREGAPLRPRSAVSTPATAYRFSDSWDERLDYGVRARQHHRVAAGARARHPFVLTGWGSIGGGPLGAPIRATRTALARRFQAFCPRHRGPGSRNGRALARSSCSRNDSTAGGIDGRARSHRRVLVSYVVGYVGVSAWGCAAAGESLRLRPADPGHVARDRGAERRARLAGLSSDDASACFGWCSIPGGQAFRGMWGTRPHGGDEVTSQRRRACCCSISRARATRRSHGARVSPGFVSEARPVSRDRRDRATPRALIGESWATGVVVISWDDAVRGHAIRRRDNVVDEFAHQLMRRGASATAPPILPPSTLRTWAACCRRVQRLRRGRRS